MSDTFKMVIPKEVERKIRYLQNKYPHTEWSGVLFTTHSGSFENKDLVITCVDIFPMDLGNAVYTEFKMSPDVAAYIAEHCDTLWDCDLQLCHSHHSMAAWFSGTDLSTLRSEGNDTNNFISLIVNNEGTYAAAITRKVEYTEEVFELCSTTFFDGEPTKYENRTRTAGKSRIEYFMLDIEKEGDTNPFSYIDQRFREIEENKRQMEEEERRLATRNSPLIAHHSSVPKEPSFFSDEEMGTIQQDFDPTVIHDLVAKMLLCSLLINTEKIDVDKWVANNMVKAYDKAFDGASSMRFVEYTDWVVDYMIDSFADTAEWSGKADDQTFLPSLCQAVVDELCSYDTENNPYMDAYIQAFSNYLEGLE